jgi:dGTPase
VFVAGEGDHYRTRLTHTMEVAQVSRDMARTLRLNEDLAECIALAHDLGHPPFGHAGEAALDAWAKTQGTHGFEHNVQSYRIVTLLEERMRGQGGLNLQREVLAGLLKHTPEEQRPEDVRGVPQSLEAQLVNLADEIAYTAHDCDDGLRAGLFRRTDLAHVPLVAQSIARAKERGTELRGSLIHILVHDVYAQAGTGPGPIRFSATVRADLTALRAILRRLVYAHPSVMDPIRDGQGIVKSLCERFLADPPDKVLALQERTGGTLLQSIMDYVAGMTDAYARLQHAA